MYTGAERRPAKTMFQKQMTPGELGYGMVKREREGGLSCDEV